MISTVFWIVALASVSLAFDLPCGIPFSMRNSTREALKAMESPAFDPGAFGAATLFGNGEESAPEAWIRDRNNKVPIPFCYRDENSRAWLKPGIDSAIKMWYEALGGEASKDSGHAIYFQETEKQGGTLYCGDNDDWNPEVPFETVAIEYSPAYYGGASATIGMIVNDEDLEPGEMILKAGSHLRTEQLTHELAHLLGMVHEHSREDRDKYVDYRCYNLYDFDEKFLKASGEGYSYDQFCRDWYVAQKYHFSGREYISGMSSGAYDKGWKVMTSELAYDYDSITHYPTVMNSIEPCDESHLNRCGLVKFKDSNNHQSGFAAIPKPARPSKWDVQFVKTVYPWRDPA